MQLPDHKDWPILKEMMGERDRGAALVGVGFVDAKLTEAISAHLRRDNDVWKQLFKPGRALNAFVTKANLAYMMGLIGRPTMRDLERMADVRNRFAHVPDPLDFADADIVGFCEAIGTFNRVWGSVPPEGRPPRPPTTRELFLENVSLVANWLHHQATHPHVFKNRDDLPF